MPDASLPRHTQTLPDALAIGQSLLGRKALATTLASLVSINSVNPAHGGPSGGQRQVLETAALWLAGHGIKSRIIERELGYPFLRARIDGRRPGPALLFETHIDTVSIEGMQIEPFNSRVDDERLWGRGSTDAKGQATAMLHALAARAAGTPPPHPIELALVSDEEFGFTGASALLADGIDALGIVVGEPTELHPVVAHKGVARFDLLFEGRLAHAARPERGVNAILAASRCIEKLRKIYLPMLAERHAPLLTPPTLNVARITGGCQPNLVPDRCELLIEYRLIPGETAASVQGEIQSLLNELALEDQDFKATIGPILLEASPVWTSPAAPLVRAAEAVGAAMGLPSDPIGVDYCTDASVLAAAGLPMLVVGPGSIAQAHTADESIRLADLEAGANYYHALMGVDLNP